MVLPELNYFASGEWIDPPRHSQPLEVVAADSFVVDQGRTVGYDRHLTRFAEAVNDAGFSVEPELAEFVSHCEMWIPREGQWFPRYDLVSTGEQHYFRYHHRLAPAQQESASLIVAPQDTRLVPHRKGPDLERMGDLRRWAYSRGAQEALILSLNGVVIEGAYSAIAVIDPDTNELALTPDNFPRIPSVTEEILCGIANDNGLDVVKKTHTVAQLEGKEVWVLSALHGIRVATDIADGPSLSIDESRQLRFQKLLAKNAREIETAH
jgi:branched-subunit amino acid aminotransferase/4-amino-4-deoxychorismate lyase